MKYKILTRKQNRWGEGYQYGDIVEFDEEAARVPLERNEIEAINGVKEINRFVANNEKSHEVKFNHKKDTYECTICGKNHKIDSKIGQSHLIEINKGQDKVILAKDALSEFKSILDELGVIFWLDYGTLLGAYRDKAFCKDDEDDIDLCSWVNYQDKKIVSMAVEKGFSVYHIWEKQYSFIKNEIKIDLFFSDKKGKDAITYLYRDEKEIPQVIPAHFYEQLAIIEFYGEIFNMPREIESFLEHKYGDWKTPVHRSEYNCFEKKNNKLIK